VIHTNTTTIVVVAVEGFRTEEGPVNRRKVQTTQMDLFLLDLGQIASEAAEEALQEVPKVQRQN
jgi:hypothetical protein